jgi:hypothetical protein
MRRKEISDFLPLRSEGPESMFIQMYMHALTEPASNNDLGYTVQLLQARLEKSFRHLHGLEKSAVPRCRRQPKRHDGLAVRIFSDQRRTTRGRWKNSPRPVQPVTNLQKDEITVLVPSGDHSHKRYPFAADRADVPYPPDTLQSLFQWLRHATFDFLGRSARKESTNVKSRYADIRKEIHLEPLEGDQSADRNGDGHHQDSHRPADRKRRQNHTSNIGEGEDVKQVT